MSMRWIILPLVIIALNACSSNESSKNSDSGKANGQSSDQNEALFDGKLTEENVLVNFEEMSTPRAYQMTIIWPKQIKRMSIKINDKAPIIKMSDRFQDIVFSEVPLNIEMTSYGPSGDAEGYLLLKKEAPLDYVLNETLSLKETTFFNTGRFYMTANAQIITNGNVFSINTKKLYIEPRDPLSPGNGMAHIINRDPYNKITSVYDYKPSFNTVTADQAVGDLTVVLAGLNGRDGDENAYEGLIKCECGRNSVTAGTLDVYVKDSSQFSVKVVQYSVKPGPGGTSAPEPRVNSNIKQIKIDKKQGWF